MMLGDLYFFIKGYIRAKISLHLSGAAIAILQKKKFTSLSHRMLKRSPFYAKYVGSDLKSYPIINKKIHMDNFNSINTKGLNGNKALDIAIESEHSRDFSPEYGKYAVGLSSGTSGSRGLFVLSSAERAKWAGYIIGKMLPISLKSQKVAFFLRANNNLYETANGKLLTFKFFDLLNGIESNIELLNDFSPNILIAPASVLRRIAESAIEINPERVISVAEVLENDDKEIIERKFNVRIEQIYQCTEGFLAATCKDGALHLNEDAYIIEKKWIDKKSGRFSPIVTDLNRSTQPVIRYLLDDILILNPVPCSCGSSMTRIDSIEGRCDDVLSLERCDQSIVDVFPDFIRNTIVSSSKNLEQFRVVQKSKHRIEIAILPFDREIVKSIKKSLETLWKKLSVLPPDCCYIEFSHEELDKKQRRVVSEYNG
ncbi:F390 synthetase-related protein [Microbulbifer sp. CNSA002]|uniref:F390 synthetase-related protein n=1 Tax=Microbulbifer sp. CNSA002 TaxID=3373604 RepID=UPI0039B54BE0